MDNKNINIPPGFFKGVFPQYSIPIPTKEQIEAAKKIRQENFERQLDMDQTLQTLSVIFALVFSLCLIYLTHFWTLKGDDLVRFIACISFSAFLVFYGYPRYKDRF
jgi:uncharacterized membrane protein